MAVEALDILGVRAVEDEKGLQGQPGEALDLGFRDHRAGRVVGVGDEDERRAGGRCGEDGVDVGAAGGLGHLYGRGASGEGGDAVHAEAVLGMDHLGAQAGVGLAEEGDDLVRAGATDDTCGVGSVDVGDGGAEARVGCVGVEVELDAAGQASTVAGLAPKGSRSS